MWRVICFLKTVDRLRNPSLPRPKPVQQLYPVLDPRLAVDAVEVGLHRAKGDEELFGDLFIGGAAGHGLDYLGLPGGYVPLLHPGRQPVQHGGRPAPAPVQDKPHQIVGAPEAAEQADGQGGDPGGKDGHAEGRDKIQQGKDGVADQGQHQEALRVLPQPLRPEAPEGKKGEGKVIRPGNDGGKKNRGMEDKEGHKDRQRQEGRQMSLPAPGPAPKPAYKLGDTHQQEEGDGHPYPVYPRVYPGGHGVQEHHLEKGVGCQKQVDCVAGLVGQVPPAPGGRVLQQPDIVEAKGREDKGEGKNVEPEGEFVHNSRLGLGYGWILGEIVKVCKGFCM